MSQHQLHSTGRRTAQSGRVRHDASHIFVRHASQIKRVTYKRIKQLKRSVSQTQESTDASSHGSAGYARTCSRHSFANSVNASGFLWPSKSRNSSHPAHTKYPTVIHQWIC
jgi:hypothetical protein